MCFPLHFLHSVSVHPSNHDQSVASVPVGRSEEETSLASLNVELKTIFSCLATDKESMDKVLKRACITDTASKPSSFEYPWFTLIYGLSVLNNTSESKANHGRFSSSDMERNAKSISGPVRPSVTFQVPDPWRSSMTSGAICYSFQQDTNGITPSFHDIIKYTTIYSIMFMMLQKSNGWWSLATFPNLFHLLSDHRNMPDAYVIASSPKPTTALWVLMQNRFRLSLSCQAEIFYIFT